MSIASARGSELNSLIKQNKKTATNRQLCATVCDQRYIFIVGHQTVCQGKKQRSTELYSCVHVLRSAEERQDELF